MFQVEIAHDYRPKIDLYYREERKRWVLDYFLPPHNQKRISVTLPPHYSRAKALHAKEEKYAQLREGKLTEKEMEHIPRTLTIDGAIEAYKKITFLHKSDKTKEFDIAQLRKTFEFFKEKLEYTQIHQIKSEDILKFRSYLVDQVSKRKAAEKKFKERNPKILRYEEKKLAETVRTTGMAAVTARGFLRDLKKILNCLYLHDAIKANPYKKIPPLEISRRDLIRSTTPRSEDLQKLLNAPYEARSNVDFPIKEFVEFLAETGARDGEAVHLEWSDIANGIWHIRNKPECPTKYGIGWTPKWSKERKIVLSPRALQILGQLPRYPVVMGYTRVPKEERLRARFEGRKVEPVGYSAQFVFTIKDFNKGNEGGRRRVEDYGKTWDMLLRKAGLPDYGPSKLHPHDFRRFKNKQDEYRGKTVEERAKQLGHAVAVNQTSYRGEDDDQILAIKAQINQIRFEIKQSFESGNSSAAGSLLVEESKLRMQLSALLGNDINVLFSAV
ncbi:MAG: hypothetical protein COT74_00385 [Bdellovibrionales bacterium CG10_big_fil_rev_8_21_14_0_10_45_34]|nr:MAG: hypothetical protein COT74_00385 [Bdellovibrionales bacterium CG10_big_fil_rev_8_21_14_0_10_45_34]